MAETMKGAEKKPQMCRSDKSRYWKHCYPYGLGAEKQK